MRNYKWIETTIAIISSVFSILGITVFTMPIGVYALIMLSLGICFFICFVKMHHLNKCLREHSKKIKKLSRKISKLDYEDSSDKIEKLNNKRNKEIKEQEKQKNQHKNTVDIIKLIVFIFVVFLLPGCKPIKTVAKEFMKTTITYFSETKENPKEQDESVQSNPKEQDESIQSDSKEQDESVQSDPKEQGEKWIKFSLEYPDCFPLNNEQRKEFENLCYCLFYNDSNNLNEVIKSDINIWMNSCKKNVKLDEAITSSGRSTEYYSNIEKNFTNEDGVLLSSDLLDQVIKGRMELYGLYPNWTLAWLLANHMQTYALNYLYQTSSADSILYFYLESIKYTQESLDFDMDVEKKYEQIRYLHSRYKDIAECRVLDENIRTKASEIDASMQEVLDELCIP